MKKKEKKREKINFYFMLQIAAIMIILVFSAMYVINKSLTSFAIFETQPSASEGKDVYIRESSDNNYGEATTLRIGKASNGINFRSLIEFNISSIEEGNTITLGILQLYVSAASNTEDITIKIYRVTKTWDEGTGTGSVTGNGATWNNATSSELWASSGGDYAEEIDSVTFTNESDYWYNFTITPIITGWYNGSYSNYGLILVSSDAENGNYTDISSSDAADSSLRPKLTIDYTSNAAPTISEISTNTNLTSPKLVNENIIFTISWGDLEGNQGKALICNSTNISVSQGCGDKTFCNTSYSPNSPITCQYTISNSENRTQAFFAAICDSANCSSTNQSSFYMNHLPNISLIQPNGNEIINQSEGNYPIRFNVSDADSDSLTASLYYGSAQNSTTNSIASNLNLISYCTDADSMTSTTNNCSYSWNSSGIYGYYFLTIILNDTYITANDSSNSSFNVTSVIDSTPPDITAQWFESYIYSGKTTFAYANVSDQNIQSVWLAFNYTSQNITMYNTSLTNYNTTFTAPSVGSYKFKIYARDVVGNLNDSMSWQEFNVTKPQASPQNSTSPSSSLPYHVIKITSQLNATDSLRDVYAYLNSPSEFTFLSDYPQNSPLGNFSDNETKTATWFLSTPITESSYVLNVTFTDYYSNSWNSSNMNLIVTSGIGGYSLIVSGYPEVETGENYYAEASFKISEIATAPDSIKITLYNPAGAKIVDSVSMTEKETGAYNYSYPVPGSGATEGQWETRVNATKNSISYYSNQFWKLVGGVFDVRSIIINDNVIPSLSISVTLENTGGADKDMFLSWNLTKENGQTYLISGLDTVRVNAYSTKTHTITPSTNYIGQVRITFVGEYSAGEKAGAYKVFSTTSEGAVTTTGGGGGAATIEKKSSILIQNFEKEIKLARGIEKTTSIEISNIGEKILTDITLELEGLNKSYYKITPVSISSLAPNKTQKFIIKFFITDLMEETEFNYLVRAKEVTAKESGKIIVTSMKEFLLSELERLKEKIVKTKEKIIQTKEELLVDLLSELSTCESTVKTMEFYIQEERFIEANADIKEADDCIDEIEEKISGIKKESPLKLEGYWLWIITWLLILILIAAISFAIYLIYKKLSIAEFLKKESKTRPLEESGKIKKNSFDEKIKRIEEKLK